MISVIIIIQPSFYKNNRLGESIFEKKIIFGMELAYFNSFYNFVDC